MKDTSFTSAPDALEGIPFQPFLRDSSELRDAPLACNTATCVTNDEEVAPIKADVAPLLKYSVVGCW